MRVREDTHLWGGAGQSADFTETRWPIFRGPRVPTSCASADSSRHSRLEWAPERNSPLESCGPRSGLIHTHEIHLAVKGWGLATYLLEISSSEHAAGFEVDNLINIAHSGQSVCDHDGRHIAFEFFKCLGDRFLCLGVEGTCRFIQDEKLGPRV